MAIASVLAGLVAADTSAHALALERAAQLRAAGHSRIADLLMDGIKQIPVDLDAPQRLAALVALADAATRTAPAAGPARPIDPLTAARAGARAVAILDGAPVAATAAPNPAIAALNPATAALIPATSAPNPATAALIPAISAPVPATSAPVPATPAPNPATSAPVAASGSGLPPTRVAIVGLAADGKVDAVMLDAEARSDLAFGQRWRIVRDGKALLTVEITRLSGGFAGCRPDPAAVGDPPAVPKAGDLAEFVADP